MARLPRNHIPGMMYHIMIRGNNREKIFFDTADYYHFCNRLKESTKKFDCKIHLYCLMTNHIHIVIEVLHIPIGKIIQTINSPYANAINKKNNRVGHLFQGRYKSKMILDENYLRELCFYIHNNPVKAKITSDMNNYQWSSHHVYTQKENMPWVTTSHILKLLGETNNTNNRYQEFIKSKMGQSIETSFCDFDSHGQLTVKSNLITEEKTIHTPVITHLSIMEIANTICNCMNISLSKATSSSRQFEHVLTRSMICYFAHYHARYPIKKISLLLGRKPAAVSKTMHRILASDRHIKLVDRWTKLISDTFVKITLEK